MRKKLLKRVSAPLPTLLWLMLLSLLPAQLSAHDITFTYEGQTLIYTVLDEEAKTVMTKNGTYGKPGNYVSGDLIIPSVVKDGDTEYTVTAIGGTGFEDCSGLTSVTIPGSVTSVGGSAFAGCSRLKDVTLADGDTELSFDYDGFEYVFEECPIETLYVGRNLRNVSNAKPFYGKVTITTLTIGNSVTSISRTTFYGCSRLTSVTIPGSVTSLGEYAFYGCSHLKDVTLADGDTELSFDYHVFTNCPIETLYVGRNLGNLYTKPFSGKTTIATLTIGNSVTSIEESAFQDCGCLTSVLIPGSLTSIGKSAFAGCNSLASVLIPGSVTSIGENAFAGCNGLKKSAYPNTISNPFTSRGIVISYDPEAEFIENGIIWGPNKTSVYFVSLNFQGDFSIPETVDSIGEYAFAYCKGLTSVTIPGSVNEIKNGTFAGCSGLTSVTIPGSVTSIGEKAFYDCSALTSVTIPGSVTSIGESAFYGCSGLTSVVSLSETAPEIQTNCFEGAYDTAEVTIPDNSLKSYLMTNWALFSNLKTTAGLKASIFTDDVFRYRVNGENSAMLIAGDYQDMTSVSIPDRVVFDDKFHFVTCIGSNAFENCEKLTALVLPTHLEEIRERAFFGANIPAPELSFPTTLTKIYDSAFSNTTGIANVTLPENMTYIGNSSFANSSDLTSINLPVAAGMGCFKNAKKLSTISLAEKVDSIAGETFAGCVSLESITLPENLKTIGNRAFASCSGLTSVNIPNSVNEIKDGTFYGCSGLTSVTIPNPVTSIGDEAFRGCSGLASVTIPGSVTSIGKNAFNVCSGLKDVTLADGDAELSVDFAVFGNCPIETLYMGRNYEYSGGDSSGLPFYGKTTITTLTIGNSVTSIGDEAFYGCSGLTALTIHSSVNSIGNRAFRGCSGMTKFAIADGVTPIVLGENFLAAEVTDLYMGRNWSCESGIRSALKTLKIGNAVTQIPDNSFDGCQTLESVTLGASIENIGAGAFKNCNLTELVLSPATSTIGENAFQGNSLKNIAMGANVTAIGANAFDGSNGLEGVSITAVNPPAAENTTFSFYGCPLYVTPSENDVVKNAYYNYTRCWYRFSSYDLIPIQEVKINNNSSIELEPGETIKLTATFIPEDASLPYIFWRSTNPDIATVDEDGVVTRKDNSDSHSRAAQDVTCQIIAETLYADGPIAAVTIAAPGSGVEDIIVDSPAMDSVKNRDIYTLQGVCLKRNATDEDVKALSPGFYIIGGKKMIVR